jgi:hypothetical protein
MSGSIIFREKGIADPSIPEFEHPVANPSIPGNENKETSIPGIENIYVVWKRSLGREGTQQSRLYLRLSTL